MKAPGRFAQDKSPDIVSRMPVKTARRTSAAARSALIRLEKWNTRSSVEAGLARGDWLIGKALHPYKLETPELIRILKDFPHSTV